MWGSVRSSVPVSLDGVGRDVIPPGCEAPVGPLWHIRWLVVGTMDQEPRTSAIAQASLCTNCVSAPDCVLRIAARGRVQYCDLHEVVRAPHVPMNGTAVADHAFVPVAGLCNNCDNVRTCALRKPGQVVLHCQHYE